MEALIIVDIQNDFLPGGNLAVQEGDKIIPIVNELQKKFDLVVATQDWHPTNHKSFASQHPGHEVFDMVDLNGLEQTLWPEHCIQGSKGAEMADALDTNKISAIFRKGTDPEIDSYSGFFDNGHRKTTGLAGYLREKGVDTVYLAGLAGDVCVKFTALDAAKEGFATKLIESAVRSVNLNPGDHDTAMKELKNKGVNILSSPADI